MDIIIRTDSAEAPDAQDAGCACGCDCCSTPQGPQPSKDELLAQLKTLLSKNDANGQAQRQLDIDKLIEQIDDLSDSIEE
jgi:hypothetical protein